MSGKNAFATSLLKGPQLGVFRRRIGDFEITALLDGYSEVGGNLIIGYEPDRAKEIKKQNFLDVDAPIAIPVSAYLLNTGREIVLIDAGASESWRATLGNLHNMLQAAGISPEQIDKLLITHLHPDHVLGAIDAEGGRAFPNAELIVPEIEQKFWLDDAYVTPEREGAFKIARTALAAYKDHLRLIQSDSEVIPGVQAVHLPGHTPGHTGYIISSGSDSLFIVADLVHASALQLAEPDWGVVFDADKPLAIKTRRKVLDQAATDRLLIAGMHLPFPGFGYVAREGAAYRFAPAGWQYQ